MENNNRNWEALSMKDRASFIKLAMQNGYSNLDSIKNLYNSKNNILATGGPKENKSKRPISREEKAEAIIRSSNGINGKLNFSNIPELFSMNRWYNTYKVPQDFNASTVKGPFGAPTYSGVVSVNNSTYVDPSEIQGNLDFVDAYMGRGIPMQQYGVIQKEDGRGERRILRNSINNNPNVKVYQTYPDTLNSKDVKYLDEQLRLGLPIKGDEVVNMSNDTNPYLFQIGDSDYSYDGSNVSVIKVQLPDGSNAYKNVDLFDFNPDNWVYSIPAKGTEALRFLNNNGKPYIMTSPWYRSNKFDNRPSLEISLPGESVGMALGGPLYNEDNPIEAFQGNPYIPIVRY